ncbi:MAG: protein kinase [Chloroflexota bacterium]
MIGQVIRDYRVIEEIGSGGFGAVYRADELSVGRDVAIKVILPDYATNEKFLKRFDREAHLVAQLEHMNIVPL